MLKTQDYKRLAKQRQLEQEIRDLNLLRSKYLADLKDLGLTLATDTALVGGRVDPQTLETELKHLAALQEQTSTTMLQTQAEAVLAQARAGSRFIRLEEALKENPDQVLSLQLTPLQEEQRHYQKKQVEIFDYLAKHFAQFEATDMHEDLPDSGRKFFAQIVTTIRQTGKKIAKDVNRLNTQLEQKTKRLAKHKRLEQRALEHIHAEVAKDLADNRTGSLVLLHRREAYERILSDVKSLTAQEASLLNQINNILDLGISELEVVATMLGSIIGQNQVTRGLLFQLKDSNDVWSKAALKEKITTRLSEFDGQIVTTLFTELDRRFPQPELDEKQQVEFNKILEEVLEFQEYLGQVMVDSQSVLTGNLADLKRARAIYGQAVLDFFIPN